jgi:hypothetical protein
MKTQKILRIMVFKTLTDLNVWLTEDENKDVKIISIIPDSTFRSCDLKYGEQILYYTK